MYDSKKIEELIAEFGWEEGDEITIEVGGTSVSGIHQTEGANAKWAAPFGTVKHQKDAVHRYQEQVPQSQRHFITSP